MQQCNYTELQGLIKVQDKAFCQIIWNLNLSHQLTVYLQAKSYQQYKQSQIELWPVWILKKHKIISKMILSAVISQVITLIYEQLKIFYLITIPMIHCKYSNVVISLFLILLTNMWLGSIKIKYFYPTAIQEKFFLAKFKCIQMISNKF